ncbi:helix-turn-helix transcriptional regulator [Pseudonocardia oroxyli]|uniref:Predicted DNA-binding transcriptional regulator YafY, contains an HTH and WYL domains n=1 Tax=Pseudonocardia oroxyli TaxID=366584 RepID=A0A1G7QCL1_PSEOR|nr:YafY family protein [Pseudonocardia oroxyli]SDF96256.1 Predicted DNA-binding transcriptional regulator YafY, contains an HTH and WYL domains [Pseudonocardia oroxyli]
MASTGERTLRLLSLLQTHRYWPGPELADRLEVSPRTLRRDVDRLRELGYPVNAHRGVDGGYQLAAGAALPPLVVDDEEAVALAVGMQAAAQGAVAGIEEPALRALTKVVQVMPPRLRKRVDALRGVTVSTTWGGRRDEPLDPEALIVVAQACRDTERLEFDYTARAAQPARRHVEPHRLVPLGRRWYLVAYDLDRHDWRTFRLDRLTGPNRTGARFRPRELPTADAADFVKQGIRGRPAAYEVEVLVHAPAAALAHLDRWAVIEPDGPDRCVLRMSGDDLDWPVFALGACGAEFEVRSPDALTERVQEWAARFGRSGISA